MKFPSLVLGWQVNSSMDPEYWTAATPTLGGYSPEHLVCVPTPSLAHHTVIVAQSGSGKSFFLGRLIEEILVRTRARCLVLDPNGDFLRIDEVSSAEELWKKPHYDVIRRVGMFTHELGRTDFAESWKKIKKRIRGKGRPEFPLILPWTSVSARLVACEIDPMRQHEVVNCHLIVQSLARLARGKRLGTHSRFDLLNEAEHFQKNGGVDHSEVRKSMPIEYKRDQLATFLAAEQFKSIGISNPSKSHSEMFELFVESEKQNFDRDVERIIQLIKYTSPDSSRFYFGHAKTMVNSGIFTAEVRPTTFMDSDYRLDVVDLPSIVDSEAKSLALNAMVEEEWRHAIDSWRRQTQGTVNADKRVPTFIVVDEAHNLVPAEPENAAASVLREQFRKIAAEGRKYGLFLILVSQRPDKLDGMVVSECENKVVMRIGSETVLAKTRELLGLEDIAEKQLRRCLDFASGRGLLAGAWAPEGASFFYAGSRRTVEGGKNLDAKFWAISEENSKKTKKRTILQKKR